MIVTIDAMINTKKPQSILVVYSREECHLCQDMIHALQLRQKQSAFKFEVIDIDDDPQLVSRYGEHIPVLLAFKDGPEICHYHLDQAALDAYLSKIR